MKSITESPAFKLNGFVVLGIVGAITAVAVWRIGSLLQKFPGQLENLNTLLDDPELLAWAIATLFVIVLPSISGFFTVEPNEAMVLTFFGRYIGTVRDSGFWWANPFAGKRRISLRIRNFNSKILKVNEAQGSPIEIASVVVWQVQDTAKTRFAVDNYEEFVATQSETAIRTLAVSYPYDAPVGTPSLRGVPDEILIALQGELQARLAIAGVEVLEARLSHLAYAPEIAQAMLRRQQAQAIIDARRQIVDSAVGMVDEALKRLSEEQIVELDEERKATMVNNLLVVLTSEQNTQPVINTGTLYA
ncbi:SPFH domain-containing protein [Leptolyngbya sp. AN03gr2]|uniref:SPFH domain-containing protein n=1 Tax=unclassified Leptolyngbya TaxID=2650499 RepID=UPI003D31B71D